MARRHFAALSLAFSACLLTHATASAPSTSQLPLLLGSGQALPFAFRPEKSYCLISDPCVHVNGLTGPAPAPSFPASWIQGVGIRSGRHTLILRVAQDPQSLSASAPAPLALAMLDYADVRGSLRRGQDVRSEDGALSVQVLEGGRLLLVSLHECNVRLLLHLHDPAQHGKAPVPHFVVSALDWPNLDSPHGILGQMFPNRARPHLFTPKDASDTVEAPPSADVTSTAATGHGSTSARGSATPVLPVHEALARLKTVRVRAGAMDGLPDDYVSSGLLEPDCMFSRFSLSRGRRQGGTARATEGEDEADEEAEEEEAQASVPTLEHAARSAGTLQGGGPRQAGGVPKLKGGRRVLGRKGSRLSSADMQVIAATHGTEEGVAEAQRPLAGTGGRQGAAVEPEELRLSHAELRVIGRTHGTVEVAGSEEGENAAAVPHAAASDYAGKWRSKLTRSDLIEISGTHGTVEDHSGGKEEGGARSSVELLSHSDLQVLSHMQGTSDAAMALASGTGKELRLTREDAQVIAQTQGTVEAGHGGPEDVVVLTSVTAGPHLSEADAQTIEATHGTREVAAA